ncbi:hypothetical protein NP233_g9365 [Leucocoprinus birnbaumii]|uniref:Uncharacterized protein n=1 Tax=Leucocoprinus birnbaumii TaxID=56174 RepID=A0AAD5VKI1_9AGAR|nr:hypothetical protein NP233_g9365 [Leucocoprinus birnbaumii]
MLIIIHSLDHTKCRAYDQEWIRIFVLKHQNVQLNNAERSNVSTYLRQLWLEIARRDQAGPIVALISRGPHINPDEPKNAPKHMTIRFLNQHIRVFATAHIPPRIGETVRLLRSKPRKWNGANMSDRSKFEMRMQVGVRGCVKTASERNRIIDRATTCMKRIANNNEVKNKD